MKAGLATMDLLNGVEATLRSITTAIRSHMNRRIVFLLICLFGFSCTLLLHISYTGKFTLTSLVTKTNTEDSTFLHLEVNQEAVSELHLCRDVLQRTKSFRNGLLEECEHLASKHPVFKTFLEKTLAYLSWHNSATAQTAPARPSLTWKCLKRGPGCGGYGDQIRGIAYAFVLASLTGRMLYIQWPSLYTTNREVDRDALEHRMFVPNALNWSLPSFLSNASTTPFCDHGPRYEAVGVCEALYSHTQHIVYSVMHWHTSCFNESLMENKASSLDLKGFVKLPRNVLECATTIIVRLLLQYSKAVHEKMEELKRTLGVGPDTHFAAVHIRTGMFPSGLNESAGWRLEHSYSLWEKDIKCALKGSKALGINGPLVLVSDSVQCKEWVRKAFGKHVLISTVNPVHVAIDTKYRSNLSKKEKKERYLSVLATTAELALLSDATVVVMAASGFSRVSTWLGGLAADHKLCCNVPCSRYRLNYP